MSTSNRDKLIDSLYNRCQIRTATSKEVFDGLVSDLGLFGHHTQQFVEKAIEIIRPYKNSGTKLESTADALYAILYPNKDDKQNVNDIWYKNEP